MSNRVQLNKRVPKPLRDKIKQDAERNPRISEDVIVAAIISDFFKAWTVSERAKFYHSYNISGR
jgi:hypothetical protein